MNNASRHYQSAFCLIEVVVALLLFSLSIVGIGKVLVESHIHFHRAEKEEKIIMVAWNIADRLRSIKTSINITEYVQYWQKILEEITPECHIEIKQQHFENRQHYTIQIQWGKPKRTLDFQVLTVALV